MLMFKPFSIMKRSCQWALVCLVLAFSCLRAEPVPPWWIERGVVNINLLQDDHALANQGQLKHIASLAKLELDSRLQGGAGAQINELVNSWSMPGPNVNDYAVVTIEQAKAVASLFYARIGVPVPWANIASQGSQHEAAVVVGQVKDLFAFTWAPPEGAFLGGFVRRSQQSELDELGLNPYPTLTKISGDSQMLESGEVLAEPLVVKANAGLFAMPAVKIRFSVPQQQGVAGTLIPTENPSQLGISPRILRATNSSSEASVLWRAPIAHGIYVVSARLLRWPAAPPVTFVVQVGSLGLAPDQGAANEYLGLQLFTPLHLMP